MLACAVSGPKTWSRRSVAAAVLTLEKVQRGIYNIAEPSGYLSTEKAQRELGFDAGARLNAAA